MGGRGSRDFGGLEGLKGSHYETLADTFREKCYALRFGAEASERLGVMFSSIQT